MMIAGFVLFLLAGFASEEAKGKETRTARKLNRLALLLTGCGIAAIISEVL